MKSFAILSVLTTVVLAQSSNTSSTATATPVSTANPLIPTGISQGCSSFLTTFDSDGSLSSCTQSIISAASQFGPDANSTTSPSASDVSTALDTLCSSSTDSCTESMVRGKLTDFYSACTAELTYSPDANVIRTYDVLYTLTPLQNAVCTKDETGKYCVAASNSSTPVSDAKINIAEQGTSASSIISILKQYLWTSATIPKRDTTSVAIVPNVTTYADSNLLFLFLTPNTPTADLCTSCTRSVLTSYIEFESAVPYGPGLAKSPLMSGQSALYTAVQSQCGASFFTGAVQAAGGISTSDLGSTINAAPRSTELAIGAVAAVLVGIFASLL